MALWPAAYEQAARQAGQMAAPTSAVQKLKKILANGEPSTDGLKPLNHAGLSQSVHDKVLARHTSIYLGAYAPVDLVKGGGNGGLLDWGA